MYITRGFEDVKGNSGLFRAKVRWWKQKAIWVRAITTG